MQHHHSNLAKMSPLLQAILWNNHGARLLELGDLENAFVWIRLAASVVDGVVSMLVRECSNDAASTS
jgi:hypothetical protein